MHWQSFEQTIRNAGCEQLVRLSRRNLRDRTYRKRPFKVRFERVCIELLKTDCGRLKGGEPIRQFTMCNEGRMIAREQILGELRQLGILAPIHSRMRSGFGRSSQESAHCD